MAAEATIVREDTIETRLKALTRQGTLVNVLFPVHAPFVLDKSRTLSTKIGISSSAIFAFNKSKLGRAFGLFLLVLFGVATSVQVVAVFGSVPGLGWLGAVSLIAGAYPALIMNIDLVKMCIWRFDALFMGINLVCWLLLIPQGIESTSIHIGSFAILHFITYICWDAFPAKFRAVSARSTVLLAILIMALISAGFFFGLCPLDHEYFLVDDVKVSIRTRLAMFGTSIVVYGLKGVNSWRLSKPGDFYMLRCPVTRIFLSRELLDVYEAALQEVMESARQVALEPANYDTVTVVMCASLPVSVNTGQTLALEYFGRRVFAGVFCLTAKGGWALVLGALATSHFLVFYTLYTGSLSLWLVIVCTTMPASLFWFLWMNVGIKRRLLATFESLFLVLNVSMFSLACLLAFEDVRMTAIIISYSSIFWLSCFGDAFHRRLLPRWVRLWMGLLCAANFSFLSCLLFFDSFDQFQDRHYCIGGSKDREIGAGCLSLSQAVLGSAFNLIIFLFKFSIAALDSDNLRSLARPLRAVHISREAYEKFSRVHETFREISKDRSMEVRQTRNELIYKQRSKLYKVTPWQPKVAKNVVEASDGP